MHRFLTLTLSRRTYIAGKGEERKPKKILRSYHSICTTEKSTHIFNSFTFKFNI